MQLNPPSLRVLGALMEKEMTTPDAYPLTVNSLIAAANQRSSRDPVMDMTEDEVRTALHQLQDLELVSPARDTGRVPRYEHRIRTVLNLRRDETAVICLLLLRGPQTPGELRSRTQRLCEFADADAVESTLKTLMAREDGPFIARLARAAGARESRYAHLFSGVIESVPETKEPLDAPAASSMSLRVAHLEELVAELRAEVDALKSAAPH